MNNILWLFSKYSRKGASSRLRLYQYIPQLKQAGYNVRIEPLFDDEYLDTLYSGRRPSVFSVAKRYMMRIFKLRSVSRGDLLLVQGELFPWFPAFIEVLMLRGRRIVLDYDDAVFHRYDLHPSALIRFILGCKIDRLMANAKIVIVGNAYLAERAQKAGALQIECLPTVVDVDRYPLAKFHSGTFLPRVGWIGTPITWAKYGKKLFEMLSHHFADQSIEFLVIGASESERHDGNVRMVPWSEATETEQIANFSVGIMPLEDTPWARGKCGYKLIQYLACGVPVVASPVGVNREIVKEGENGYLASSFREWRQSIEKLVAAPDDARRMGVNGREIVFNKYSTQSAGPWLIQMLGRLH